MNSRLNLSGLQTKKSRGPLPSKGIVGYFVAIVIMGLCASVAEAICPANDAFRNALFLSGTSGSITGSNTGATTEAGEPVPADGSIGATVWYRWTAPANGTLLLDAGASDFNALISVFTGNQLANLVLNPDTGVSTSAAVPVATGSTYWIAVAGWWGDSGEIELAWSLASPSAAKTLAPAPLEAPANQKRQMAQTSGTTPANDSFYNPQFLSGAGGPYCGTNINASEQEGEPNHLNGANSVWYEFDAPNSGAAISGLFSIQVSGSGFNPVLAVYTGTNVGKLELVKDEASVVGGTTNASLEFYAAKGKKYHIVVDGQDGGSGDFTLTFSQIPATIEFAFPPVRVGCNASYAVQWVTREGDLKSPAAAYYSTGTDGTAQEGLDYTGKSGFINFAPNQARARIRIGLKKNDIPFYTKSFNLSLLPDQSSTNAVIGSGSTTQVTIINQNNPEGVFQFTRPTYSYCKKAGVAEITVERTGPAGCRLDAATVDCTTLLGSASTGDYVAQSYTLVFLSGVAKQMFYVPLMPQAVSDPDNYFTVELNSPALDSSVQAADEPILGIRDTATVFIDR